MPKSKIAGKAKNGEKLGDYDVVDIIKDNKGTTPDKEHLIELGSINNRMILLNYVVKFILSNAGFAMFLLVKMNFHNVMKLH
ncbi:MAG: hypothetical protein JXK07_16235 [Spirochaetes bacterium]|nr:hypothetical protein [Spirochaetota bacterium]MBN2770639.1 hypothetical protein [Spirochaetota bacterium]